MNTPTLQRGKAIVIVSPQGTRKSQIARKIAERGSGGVPAKTFRVPNFIFTTGHLDPLFDETQTRRFTVVRLGQEAPHV